MKGIILLTTFISASLLVRAQSVIFEEIAPLPPTPQNIANFSGVSNGDVAFADVDGDNDQDVLITGDNYLSHPIAELYINDGVGNYSLVIGTPFTGVEYGSIAFADIDNDNDQDVLITGTSTSGGISKLYTNNGHGYFTLVSGTPFTGVGNGSIAFADIDGDNDQDVLITGYTNLPTLISELYTNDGLGNYTLVPATTFTGVDYSSIAFSDMDGDGDADVLITGKNSSNITISEIYSNDGSGGFTLLNGTSLSGVEEGDIAFADIDGDNDQDVLLTGYNNSYVKISELYTNDGSGNYILKTGMPFIAVALSSIAFADIDGDNDQDVLITGSPTTGNQITELYKNDGAGNYTLVNETQFSYVESGSIAFTDIDGDNDLDLLMTGYISSLESISQLYTNDGLGNYSINYGSPFRGVEDGSAVFADIDGDNDQDILLSGSDFSNLYKNDGMGNYNLITGTTLTGVNHGFSAFADIDGDNDQDILITGTTPLNIYISELYKNDGAGNYTLVNGTPFPGVLDGRIAFADIDNDSDLDLLITGEQTNSPAIISQLYKNDGSGNYTLFDGTSITPIYSGSVNFSDLDNDQDLDLVITGKSVAELYLNDGNGDFIKVLGVPFTAVSNSTTDIADIDNDGDQDVIISGQNVSNNPTTVLYTNDGIGNFALVTGTIFSKISDGSIAFADVDNDNDQDLLITGKNFSINPIAELYLNNGAGNFTYASGMPFLGVKYSSIAFTDIDGDQDQDLVIIGQDASKSSKSKLYRNVSTLGIKDNGLVNKLTEVYPNPVNNELTIESQGDINQIEVYNITGQLLQTVNPKSSVVKINFSTYVQGVYLVKVYSKDGQVATSRVVKE